MNSEQTVKSCQICKQALHCSKRKDVMDLHRDLQHPNFDNQGKWEETQDWHAHLQNLASRCDDYEQEHPLDGPEGTIGLNAGVMAGWPEDD
jgi:hypothetical protein